MSWTPDLDARAAAMRESREQLHSLHPTGTGIHSRYLPIFKRAAERHGIRGRDIVGARHFPELVAARKEVATELRDMGLTLDAIARIMRRHHTAIIHYLGKGRMTNTDRIADLEDYVKVLSGEIQELRAAIAAMAPRPSESQPGPSTPDRSTPDGSATENPE